MMTAKKKILIPVYIFVFSAIFAIVFKWAQTGVPFSQETLFYGILVFLNLITLLIIAYAIFKRYTLKSIAELRKRIVPSAFLFALVILAIQLIIISFGVYLYFIINELDTSDFFKHLFSVEIPGALKQYAIWILVATAVFFYFIWKRAVDSEQALREENLKHRYRNLKSQVNPHFLFNSLNTLSELVYDDPEKADRYIQKLSDIYRYVLEYEEEDLVPLDKEIGFVKAFFELHRERERGKMKLNINTGNGEGLMLIPVSLQSLVENAIKHNIASREKPLDIEISREGDMLVISNNINRKNRIGSSISSGLENLGQRVMMISGRKMEYYEEKGIFIVKMPLIQL